MASPIRVHRPKCDLAGEPFARFRPWYGGVHGACSCFEFPDGYRPPAIPLVNWDKGVLIVKVEWRKHNRPADYDNRPGDWYIFAWTTAPDKAWYGLSTKKDGHSWWIANNATSVRDYVRANPDIFPPLGPGTDRVQVVEATDLRIERLPSIRDWQDLIGKTVTIDIPTTQMSKRLMDLMYGTTNGVSDETLYRSTREDGTMNTDALRRQALALLEQADRIDARPDEPKGIKVSKKPKVEANIIWWRMRFTPNGRVYTYAAVKADGLWFTTGPRSPKGYTWDQLITWIYETSEAGDQPEPEIYYVTEMAV